jgi:hypothetical protein
VPLSIHKLLEINQRGEVALGYPVKDRGSKAF